MVLNVLVHLVETKLDIVEDVVVGMDFEQFYVG